MKNLFTNTFKENRLIFFAVEAPEPAEVSPEQAEMEQEAAKLITEFKNAVGEGGSAEAVKFLQQKGVDTPANVALSTPGFTYEGYYASSVMLKEHDMGASESITQAVDKAKKGEVMVAKASKEQVLEKKAESRSWISRKLDAVASFFTGKLTPEDMQEREQLFSDLAKRVKSEMKAGDLTEFYKEYNLQYAEGSEMVPGISAAQQRDVAKKFNIDPKDYETLVVVSAYINKYPNAFRKDAEKKQLLANIQSSKAAAATVAGK